MKIMHNENLTWSSTSGNFSIDTPQYENDLKKIFLISFKRSNKKTLVLTGTTDTNNRNLYVRAKNIEGEKDLDFLENKLEDYIKKSFDEIRYTDFK